MARSANFSKEEIQVILTYLENAPHLISGEFGKNCPSSSEMMRDWDNLANLVNACGMGLERTGAQVKNKWSDLKYRTKRKASMLKNELGKTGGGPRNNNKLTETEERILSLIGKTCVSGIHSLAYDSTASIIPTINEKPRKSLDEELPNILETEKDVTSEQVQEKILEACINKENNSFACDTPSSWHFQNKRTISLSTERVQGLRKNRRQSIIEGNNNEIRIIETQEKMHKNLEDMAKNQEKILEEQKKKK